MVNKRVWTDDDEIMLLEGYLEYFSDKGCSPLSDLDDFYKFMMDSLPGNATKSQLYEKIRRLKKKFRVNVEKGGPGFAKAHDSKVFDVSKRIWGDEGCEDGKRAKPKARVKPDYNEPYAKYIERLSALVWRGSIEEVRINSLSGQHRYEQQLYYLHFLRTRIGLDDFLVKLERSVAYLEAQENKVKMIKEELASRKKKEPSISFSEGPGQME
ncbi:hypothetical protein CTI12_AA466410 [Artemisia annua]|uniref:Glabrous enhancer-binding protein-like DBD domain-containing protein n=1 Tax=Artemisia annua TaxID=35608 RepID=A0A2U1LQ79_ARTAN|nr:hypothetical protein CTI12_AA466410 [Artemisia annua]